MSQQPVSQHDLDAALAACLKAIEDGAKPAKLDQETIDHYRTRYEPLFKRNLNKPQVGGWKKVHTRLVHVADKLGKIAFEIADINNSTAIDTVIFDSAAGIIEQYCRIGMEAKGNAEGLVCG